MLAKWELGALTFKFTRSVSEQIVLLQSLCEKIIQEMELPAQAIAGLGICCFGLGGLLNNQNR